MEYLKYKQVVISAAADMPNTIALLEQMDIAGGIQYPIIDLVTVFCSVSFNRKDQKWFAFIWRGQTYCLAPDLCELSCPLS